MRALALTALFLTLPRILVAQTNESERIRVEGDVKHYKGMITAYRAGDDTPVAELLTWDASRLAKTIGAINGLWDPTRPWTDDFLRSGALLQTAAGLKAREAGLFERMKTSFNLAVEQLRRGSTDLQPFAGRWFFAISRLYRSDGALGVLDAERLLVVARQQLPSNPLVLYESATIEELRATEWRSAAVTSHPGTGSSFHDVNALDDIVKDRTARLQHARDWLRQSVASAPTPMSRLHYGRVLMMRKEDAEALIQLEAARTETTDRATQYLSILFTAAVDERRGALQAAATRYRQAIDCFPESDAAYIGLSEVLQSAGRGDEARQVLHDMVKPRADRHEPWTWYFLEPKDVAHDRLNALFDEGRR